MKWAAILAALAGAAIAQDTGAVEGIVVNKITGAGVDGATVSLTGKRNDYHVVTDAAGRFRVAVFPGDYTASVEKKGYFEAPGPKPSLHANQGPAVAVRLEMIPPGKLSGRVIGIDRNPAPNVQVAIAPCCINSATTDANGAFAFDQLPAGSYTLSAVPRAGKAAPGPDGTRIEAVRTYFPSLSDRSLAEPITIRPGGDQSGYVIQMQTAPVYSVRGVVLDADGKPAAKADVTLVSRSPGGSYRSLRDFGSGAFTITAGGLGAPPTIDAVVRTDENGVFEFPSVVEGEWTIQAAIGQKNINLSGTAAMSVNRRDIDDVRIQTSPGFELRGRLELSDGSRVPNGIIVSVILSSEGGPSAGGVTLSDGTLRFSSMATARYRIQSQSPSSKYYVAAVLLGDSDITGQAVDLTASSPPIRIILKPAATLRGTVDKCEDATIILAPQKLAAGDLGFSTPCKPGGMFDFAGLPPGNYYAIAMEQVNPREISDAARLRELVPRATSVRVEATSTAFVELKVVR